METESEEKEKPQNEYFPNGKSKVIYEFNGAGNVSKRTLYNRYGIIKYYETAEAWDANGNITRKTEYMPNSSGKYKEYHYIYTYDANGNVISWSYTYADGSKGNSGTSEYDSNDHLIIRSGQDEKGNVSYIDKNFHYDAKDRVIGYTSYNADGTIAYIEENYQYDEEDHLISYVSYNADGTLKYEYHASFANSILIESTNTDAAGNITEKYTYDPIYGDELSSNYEGSNGDKYEKICSYYDNYYEEDWRSLDYGYRTVTQYSAVDGKIIKRDDYRRENTASKWEYESTTEYSVNASGNSVQDRTYADGSTYRSIQDSNGNTIYSRSTKGDGSFAYAYSCEYDSKGREIRSTHLDEAGNTESYTLYKYDNQDRQILSTTYKADDSFWYARESIYDGKGNKVRENSLDENGKTESYYLYEYGENGERTYMGSFRAGGTKSYEAYYRTLDDGTQQHKYFWYNSDGSLREEEDWE